LRHGKKIEDKLFIVTITSHKNHRSYFLQYVIGICVISTQISPQSSVIEISWNTRKGELHWTLERNLKHLHASSTEIWERNCTDRSAKPCYKAS
jgi:hypothetical protein